jgi:hypothetical protein
MGQPEPPASFPKYLAEGISKQNVEILHDVREYVDALIEYREHRLRPTKYRTLPSLSTATITGWAPW